MLSALRTTTLKSNAARNDFARTWMFNQVNDHYVAYTSLRHSITSDISIKGFIESMHKTHNTDLMEDRRDHFI